MCEAMCNPSLLSLRGVGVLGRWSEVGDDREEDDGLDWRTSYVTKARAQASNLS